MNPAALSKREQRRQGARKNLDAPSDKVLDGQTLLSVGDASEVETRGLQKTRKQ